MEMWKLEIDMQDLIDRLKEEIKEQERTVFTLSEVRGIVQEVLSKERKKYKRYQKVQRKMVRATEVYENRIAKAKRKYQKRQKVLSKEEKEAVPETWKETYNRLPGPKVSDKGEEA